MITLKTLELYLEKCKDAEGQVVAARAEKYEQIRALESEREALLDQLKVISGQQAVLGDLMNIGENHNVELPFAGDDIEELHDTRLEGYKGKSLEEVRKFREDKAYSRESMEIVGQIDESNRAESAGDEGGSTEVDS